MKCPLQRKSTYTTFEQINSEPMECLLTKCAWWMDGDAICALPAIAGNLNIIEADLGNIYRIMPEHRQFRK